MPAARPPWTERLTPRRCRAILAAILLLGFGAHLHYLTFDCPIDLSGDEAYYWDWSRRLDWCYHSKPPGVAVLIRASCAVFGDNMPAVRLPALLLAVGTGILYYWLARKLFGSERLALGTVLLSHLVPMFVAGSVMMTIDPPLFFCWTLATCFAAKAVADDAPAAWLGAGAAVGLGLLCKFSMPLWLLGPAVFMVLDRRSRAHLRTVWPWLGLIAAAVCAAPLVIWNMQRGWVSALHVGADVGGGSTRGFAPRNILLMAGGQLAAIGPLLLIMAGAVWHVLRALRAGGCGAGPLRGALLLAATGVPYWLTVAGMSLWSKVQVNWPAPAYSSLLVLAAWFMSTRLEDVRAWRGWRWLLAATVVLGALCIALVHQTHVLYRPVHDLAQSLGRKWPPQKWDPSYRLRGWRDLGEFVSDQLAGLRPGAFVLCEKYEFAAETAFYVRGQPKTYYAGSWFADPARRGAIKQYDIWDDRRLDRAELIGRDAVFVGYGRKNEPGLPPEEIAAAFRRVDRVRPLQVQRDGVPVRTFNTWRCYGFKGMKRPPGGPRE